jgi:hypothetical protein
LQELVPHTLNGIISVVPRNQSFAKLLEVLFKM